MSGAFAGTGPLLRASVRHSGRGFAPWIAIVTALSASSVLIYPWLFPDQRERMALASAVHGNPALSVVFGPAFDLSTTDGFNAWRSLALGGFLTALGSILAVIRATRGQEDSGQAELFASGVLGRWSRLLTGVCLGLLGSLAVGVVAGVVTWLCRGAAGPSFLLAATFVASGAMFVGVAAVAAQLGSDARTANSLAIGTLGVLFLARGFAYAIDLPSWTVWVNPLGWMTETRPATGDRWWPLLGAAAVTAVALSVAFVLEARRDFGQGAIAPGPGPARGRTTSTLGLALRLQRGQLIVWGIAFLLLGVVFGYFASSIPDLMAGGTGGVTSVLASGATTPDQVAPAFLVSILSLVGIIAAIPGVQTMLKIRSEEMEDRVEPLMATAVRRQRYYAGNVVVAFGAPAVYLVVAGILVATLASRAGIGVGFGGVLLQAVVTIPATWAAIAVSVAAVGARPHIALAAWIGVFGSFVLTLLGPTFKLWDWVLAISPFWHVPHVMADDTRWVGLIGVVLVMAALVAVGFVGFRRRDLAV